MGKYLDHIIAFCVIVMVVTITVSLIPFGVAFIIWDASVIHVAGPAAFRIGLALGFIIGIPSIASVISVSNK